MTFREGSSFEGGRVRTRRGGKGGAAAGGGIGLAIVAFLIYQFTGVDVSSGLATLQQASGGGPGGGQVGELDECSAADANTSRECRFSATLYTLDAFWTDLAEDEGIAFEIPGAESFEGGTSTGCGAASSAVGPFYCPADQTIYLDVSFFDELRTRFGAQGGPFAEMYVIAHEYGHHMQHLLGTMNRIDRDDTGADSDGVRLELQADCYAGMWAHDAATRLDPDTGQTFLEPLTDEDLAQALSAAKAIGDDHIQEEFGGGVNPDTWTHGSSEQRQAWFTTGWNEGTLAACDTFTADDL